VWTNDFGNLVLLENIPAENIIIYHCGSYVKNFNCKDEEIYIKTIVLEKDTTCVYVLTEVPSGIIVVILSILIDILITMTIAGEL